MKALFGACTLATALLLTGCASPTTGINFNGKAVSSLVLGTTTKDEVVKTVGPLDKTEVFTAKKDGAGKDLPNPIVVEYADYYFTDNSATAAEKNMRATRYLTVFFIDSKLASYRLSSNFSGEGTNFDEAKVSKVSKGMAESDVIAMMGQPSGRAMYPFAREVGGTTMTYHLVGLNPTTGKIHTKTFLVNLDVNRKG